VASAGSDWPAAATANPYQPRRRIKDVTVSSDPQQLSPGRPPARPGLTIGIVTGLITAAVALGVGQLVAGITGPQGSPVVAVGGAAIDLAPPPLKNFAISTFGSNDKTALVTGILVLLAVFAAAIGVAAFHRFSYGVAGLAIFTGIGLAAALTRPTAQPADILPSLAGAAAGLLTLNRLVRAANADATARQAPGGPAAPPGGQPAALPDNGAPEEPAPGASWVPRQPAGAHREQAGRRQFLVAGAVAVVAAGATGLVGRALAERTSVSQARAAVRLPPPIRRAAALPAGTDLHIPGLSPFVTPTGSFYRVDTALILPEVPPSSWQLRIHGMVAHEMTLSFNDLLKLPLLEDWVTLCCVSNPVGGPYIGNARWLGASLARLLRATGIRAGADQLLCTSVDGFTSGTPVQTVMDGRDALLAVAMDGAPLPVAHGFPARMVVPGLYGYVSACKWITDIKVTTFAAEHAYWAQRGWSLRGPIKTESRIDVPAGSATVRAGRMPVAGVAWAQHKGIDAVEVRVDGGVWNQAKLAAVPGIDTWRQWVWEWDATPGNHVIQARATDATGYTQTAAQAPPEPNGATGYPTINVSVH
jgi:DMSO/TMAO reductase YedYZ molybdopterin-dependent catalytic subunit